MFNALVLEKTPDFSAAVRSVNEDFLPEGDVTIDVEFSTLNYKDGLAITNRSPVVRSWPMVAGIDGAGTVTHSAHPDWTVGDQVILNGFGVGEVHKGCLAQRARLKGDWLVRRPEKLSAQQAMAFGTAGYTAMLCVMALERHGLKPGSGEVLVTGATGGVGSVAVAILAQLGFQVVASTGKPDAAAWLSDIGASTLINRSELSAPGKPLQKERWAAVIDAVGSHTLANACAQTRYGGAVAACGLAQGMDFPATVAPFILRGISLLGIDSVMAPIERRKAAWQRLCEISPAKLEAITEVISLNQAIEAADKLMRGEVRGRIVVDTNR